MIMELFYLFISCKLSFGSLDFWGTCPFILSCQIYECKVLWKLAWCQMLDMQEVKTVCVPVPIDLIIQYHQIVNNIYYMLDNILY